jgi:peptide deformylase
MKALQIIYAPDPIFRKIATPVAQVNDEVRALVDAMFATMQVEQAVGLGANMVGVLQRIAVVDLAENGVSKPYCFINPKITWRSDEEQSFEEASLSFVGISAEISRAKAIKVKYLDYDGKEQELEADGFFASVIQHEMDYLDGKTFLDYLSKMKRDMLVKKMLKIKMLYPPHVHGAHCNH